MIKENGKQKAYIAFILLFLAAVLLTIVNYSRLTARIELDNNGYELLVEESEVYLRSIFKNADNFKKNEELGEKYYIVYKNDSIIGVTKFIYKTISCIYCSDLYYICGIKINGEIQDVLNIETIVINGKQLNEEVVNHFFQQFKNITYDVNLYDDKIIENIDNAEKSCYQIKKGISEMFYELEKMKKLDLLYKQPSGNHSVNSTFPSS